MKRYTQAKKTQMLTGGLEHFTVATPESIVPTADGSAEFYSEEFNNYFEQARVWEQLIEIFRTRGNVVIVSELSAGGFTVAVEHKDAVDPAEIQEKIRELGSVAFGTEEVEIDPDGTPASGDEYTETQEATVDLSGVTVAKVDYDLL
jgi:hypothetical protein